MSVNRPVVLHLVWALLAVVAGASGYALGSRQGHEAIIRSLQTEAAGNLTQRIEVLSLLRMGNSSTAIQRMEGETDLLTRTIASNPGADQRALAFMKTYLSVARPSPAREKELAVALADVPVLEPAKCNSALKAFLLSAKAVVQQDK